MFHHWQVILGLLVYRGLIEQPPYKSKEHDFFVEDRKEPHTVKVRISGRTEPVTVFHPINADHAERLKRAFPLQPNYTYV